jgi:hypothetical protein
MPKTILFTVRLSFNEPIKSPGLVADQVLNALNSWRENSETGFAADDVNETYTTGIFVRTVNKGKPTTTTTRSWRRE